MPDKTPTIPDEQIPEFVRRAFEEYRTTFKQLREASTQSRKMYAGGEHQWRETEIADRRASNRPWITINCVKPVVDQVENEARNNPPGPQAKPVGGGADTDDADIFEGYVREYEYRSNAHRAYITSLKYAGAANAGVFEMATEYAGERSFEQRIVIKEVEDPDMVFCDVRARMAAREDAMYAGKIRVLSRESLIEQYGTDLKVLSRPMLNRAMGWMQEAVHWRGNSASISEWTGGFKEEGPYFVCEFYLVTIEREKLFKCSDGVNRYADEIAEPIYDRDGNQIIQLEGDDNWRWETRRRVWKYVVTALDVVSKTEWLGTTPPFFWTLGPEIYIDGKLHRLSLIDGAMDSQRGLNFAATGATEILGAMTKAPWVGYKGQFDATNAQGINPWRSSNTRLWAYMEIQPTWAINPTTKQAELLPPPIRNTWEAPIARALELAAFFREQIKSSTSVFFDPAAQSVADVESGAAIKALQSQTNIGTLNWQDNLRYAVGVSYQQAAIIATKITSAQQALLIIRPDSKHEMVRINQVFGQGEKKITSSKAFGHLSIRATAGPDTETRTDQTIDAMTKTFSIAPQLLSMPGVAAQFLRFIGQGTPQIEQLADSILGKNGDVTPDQLQAQVMQLQQSSQAKDVVIQKLQMALAAKLPDLEVRKWEKIMDMLTRLAVARVTASKDRDVAAADREQATLEALLQMAHEAAMQGADHAQAAQIAAAQPEATEAPGEQAA